MYIEIGINFPNGVITIVKQLANSLIIMLIMIRMLQNVVIKLNFYCRS